MDQNQINFMYFLLHGRRNTDAEQNVYNLKSIFFLRKTINLLTKYSER